MEKMVDGKRSEGNENMVYGKGSERKTTRK
jgi:hypothetical protein